MTTFGKKLHSLIKENKMTQKELADKLNVKRGSVSNWVTDRRMPDNNTVVELANLFNVTTDFLLGNSVDSQSTDKIDNVINLHFDNAQDAMTFILKQPSIAAFGVPDLTDEEMIEFANDILDHLQYMIYKRKIKLKK